MSTYGKPVGPWKRISVYKGSLWGEIKDRGRQAAIRYSVKAYNKAWKLGGITTNIRLFDTLSDAKTFIEADS